jgi:hypothetical protein
MKKQILGVVVMSFVTLAFLIVVNDITNNNNSQSNQTTVDIYESTNKADLATLDEAQ